MSEMREVNRFSYGGDDGKSYVVVELKPEITAQAGADLHKGYGSSVFRLEDGTALIEQDEEDVYEIFGKRIVIRPTPPA